MFTSLIVKHDKKNKQQKRSCKSLTDGEDHSRDHVARVVVAMVKDLWHLMKFFTDTVTHVMWTNRVPVSMRDRAEKINMLILCTIPFLLCKNQLATVNSPSIESYQFVSYKENAYKKNKYAHLVHHPLFTL